MRRWASECLLPILVSLLGDLFEGSALRLLAVEVVAGIVYADERHAHAHLHLLALRAVEGVVVADAVARQLASIVFVALQLPVVGVPLPLYALSHGLLLPCPLLLGLLVDAHDEVDGEHRLWVVAEGAEQSHALNLLVVHPAHHTPGLIGQPVADVEQQVSLTFGHREALARGAERGGDFGAYAVFLQADGVVARSSLLTVVLGAVVVVVHGELSAGRHGEQRAQFGTSHAAEGDMGEARQVLVVVLIGRRPPSCVFVILVEVASHHVEGYDRHQSMGQYRSRIAHREVGRADEGIDQIG